MGRGIGPMPGVPAEQAGLAEQVAALRNEVKELKDRLAGGA
jgi:hypothetical protein